MTSNLQSLVYGIFSRLLSPSALDDKKFRAKILLFNAIKMAKAHEMTTEEIMDAVITAFKGRQKPTRVDILKNLAFSTLILAELEHVNLNTVILEGIKETSTL